VRHQKKIALLNEKLETLNAKVKAREARKTRTLTALEQATVSEKASDSQATHQPALETSTRLRPRRRLYATMAAAATLLLAAALGLDYWLHEHHSESSNSIAVLPLDMQSKEADADYISDGIASSVNNRLAKLSVFPVIPNSVTQNYKGKTAEFQQISKTLGVSSVLSGRVVQHGDNLFISIELNDVRDGKQIWGQQYSRKIGDLIQLQNDIACEASQRLRTQLSEADRQKMTLGSTTNPDAYRLYLKGAYYTAKFTKDGFDQGVDYLNQALALDPNYGQAYSQLAYNYINQDDWYIDPKIAGPRAREAATKALALDETDVEAHVALAIEEQWYEWNYAAAERNFRLPPGEPSQ
jgi:TolB-like protein